MRPYPEPVGRASIDAVDAALINRLQQALPLTERPFADVGDELGLSDAQAKNSIRLGFGRYTTREELVKACRALDAAAKAQGV